MNSSKRAPPPPPLQIGVPVRSFTSPTSSTSSRSSDKTARSFSGDYAARPDFSYHNRVGSDASRYSSSSRKSSSSSSPSSSSSSPHVNVYTTCGRHSNQWLFSGWPNPFKKN